MTHRAVVLFDLDDTLFPERDFLHSGWRAVALECSRYGLNPSQAYRIMDSAHNAFDSLHDTVPELSVDRMLEIYRTHFPDIKPAGDTIATLLSIRSAGCVTGIITDGRSITQRNKIAALGLYNLMDYIGISEETGADKKSCEPFLMASEACGPAGCYIYVGDNPAKDFLWPNRLGWVSAMLLEPAHGRNIHPQNADAFAPEYRAAITLRKLSEIEKYIP